MLIQVEHHADLGAASRSLYRGERRTDIIEIMDQWYGPGYRYVKVRGRDSSVYILLFDEIRDQWEVLSGGRPALATQSYDLARSAQSRQLAVLRSTRYDRTLKTTSCSRAWSITLRP